ncbi:MAG: hypothetical protein RHS_1663 [Robinsoniella sp. RHS]|nr:MAG: hypothetical protein RHS_1663 [Robinsoniella sp. RHS]
MTVFIDPVRSEYSSPVGFTGAKRMAEDWRNRKLLPDTKQSGEMVEGYGIAYDIVFLKAGALS